MALWRTKKEKIATLLLPTSKIFVPLQIHRRRTNARDIDFSIAIHIRYNGAFPPSSIARRDQSQIHRRLHIAIDDAEIGLVMINDLLPAISVEIERGDSRAAGTVIRSQRPQLRCWRVQVVGVTISFVLRGSIEI